MFYINNIKESGPACRTTEFWIVLTVKHMDSHWCVLRWSRAKICPTVLPCDEGDSQHALRDRSRDISFNADSTSAHVMVEQVRITIPVQWFGHDVIYCNARQKEKAFKRWRDVRSGLSCWEILRDELAFARLVRNLVPELVLSVYCRKESWLWLWGRLSSSRHVGLAALKWVNEYHHQTSNNNCTQSS